MATRYYKPRKIIDINFIENVKENRIYFTKLLFIKFDSICDDINLYIMRVGKNIGNSIKYLSSETIRFVMQEYEEWALDKTNTFSCYSLCKYNHKIKYLWNKIPTVPVASWKE